MRADTILREVIRVDELGMHRARYESVFAAVLALVRGGDVGLTALGRAMAGQSHKHGIKRADRLLGNAKLASVLDTIYSAVARYVIADSRPVVLLDWTDTGFNMCSLTAAVPIKGRAIPILSMTVSRSSYGSPSAETHFLDRLAAVLRPASKPILVADAGFGTTWMKQVRQREWDFVVRIRGRKLVKLVDDVEWRHWKSLCAVPAVWGRIKSLRAKPWRNGSLSSTGALLEHVQALRVEGIVAHSKLPPHSANRGASLPR